MNSSALEVAEVPSGVVTVTSTVLALTLGDVTVIWDGVTWVTVPAVVPNSTVAPGVKLEPLIVTVVPPAVEPSGGVIPVTVGTRP